VPVGTVKSRCARGRARLLPLLTHLRADNGGGGSGNKSGGGRNRTQGASVPPAAGPHDAGPRDAGPSDSAAVKGGGGRA
jgi:RNA polymerase sigma-70 factor (ECF subfamily)